VGYNQYVILIYNLLLADLLQSMAFAITFHWLRLDKILAPTAPCFLQGWVLNLGDVASGLFVLAIAIHTWLGVIKGYRLPYIAFVITIVIIWFLAVLLTVLGPIIHKDAFFARAGGWVSFIFSINGVAHSNDCNSAGFQTTFKSSVSGSTTSGSSSSNSAPSPYMAISFSISAVASET
jgi:hypothetical protein